MSVPHWAGFPSQSVLQIVLCYLGLLLSSHCLTPGQVLDLMFSLQQTSFSFCCGVAYWVMHLAVLPATSRVAKDHLALRNGTIRNSGH